MAGSVDAQRGACVCGQGQGLPFGSPGGSTARVRGAGVPVPRRRGYGGARNGENEARLGQRLGGARVRHGPFGRSWRVRALGTAMARPWHGGEKVAMGFGLGFGDGSLQADGTGWSYGSYRKDYRRRIAHRQQGRSRAMGTTAYLVARGWRGWVIPFTGWVKLPSHSRIYTNTNHDGL
ncbi:hypothetical protein PVAP13_8NG262003 [Panicum virgatum]|uniref:Uncharacterized protein n=1 Tax=Panicum virgatum TaxID=38727 RepID=A0A8T0P6Q3_PANVG|nr:hypothetical protein PVAP13_8NG262003 [Panicum virgatum]